MSQIPYISATTIVNALYEAGENSRRRGHRHTAQAYEDAAIHIGRQPRGMLNAALKVYGFDPDEGLDPDLMDVYRCGDVIVFTPKYP